MKNPMQKSASVSNLNRLGSGTGWWLRLAGLAAVSLSLLLSGCAKKSTGSGTNNNNTSTPCTDDSECPSGMVCDGNFCVEDTVGPDAAVEQYPDIQLSTDLLDFGLLANPQLRPFSRVVLIVTFTLTAVLGAANAIYETQPRARQRPIKGFVQLLQLVVWIIGIILFISALMQQGPDDRTATSIQRIDDTGC